MSSLFGGAATSSAATSNTTGDLNKDVALSSPPEDTISSLSFSPATTQQNDFLAVSSWDKKVRIYEITQTGQSEGRHAYGHEAPILDCDFYKVGTFKSPLHTVFD
jgi:mRNA export factor